MTVSDTSSHSVELPYGPAAAPPAPAPAPAPRRITRAALWIAFGAAVALPLVAALPGLVPPFEDREAYQRLLVLGTILEAAAYLVVFASLVVAVLTARRSPGARVATILLAAVGAIVGITSAGSLGGDLRASFVLPVILFVTWALAAGFRGRGFLAIFLVFAWIIFKVVLVSVVPNRPITFLVVGLAGACATVGIVLAARAWERALAREIATSGPAALPASVDPANHNNGFATAALILGIMAGSVLPIVFGHVALSQIRRTGAPGRGMAIAGLILGYFWLAVIVIVAALGVTRAVQGA